MNPGGSDRSVPSPGGGGSSDPILFTLLLNRLHSIVVEMTVNLERSAFSPILALSRDYSCCLYDTRNRQITMVDAIPIHTNSMHLILNEIDRRFEGDINRGDIIVVNDPYSGNTHIGDFVTACPVFSGDTQVFWALTRGHQLDVGAPVPTSTPHEAGSTWEEGFIIPPCKWYDRGTPRRDAIAQYLANVRWPDVLEGDLMAQLGSVWTAERRLEDLCDRYGLPTILDHIEEAISYGERRAAAEIGQMPNGTYEAESWMDSDGVRNDIPIRCRVEIGDDSISVDFAGSARQAENAMNASEACLLAGGGLPVMMSIDPDIPHNEGCLGRIRVTAPSGSICRAAFPASTATATTEPTDRMQQVVFKALAQAIPERIPAGTCMNSHLVMFSGEDPESGRTWGHMPFNAGGGSGGSDLADGWPLHTTSAAWGGLKAASVEHTELLYPIRFVEWTIEPASMGLGKHIGGPGIRCSIRPERGSFRAINSGDGLFNPPYGMLGGTPGAGGGTFIEEPTGRRRFLPPNFDEVVAPGEIWVGVSSGGGGYGDPLQRPAEQVLRDVRDGLYTPALAAAVYGVIISEDDIPQVDAAGTESARAAIRESRGPLPVVEPNRPGASEWLRSQMAENDTYTGELG